jgi:hypothetical protein
VKLFGTATAAAKSAQFKALIPLQPLALAFLIIFINYEVSAKVRSPNSGSGATASASVEAEDWEGPSFQTCADASNVSKRFEINRRRLHLSFNHHAEVAALPPNEADALLDWCEETPKPRVPGRAALSSLLPTLNISGGASPPFLPGRSERYDFIRAMFAW